jgi:DnaK suppressor protein
MPRQTAVKKTPARAATKPVAKKPAAKKPVKAAAKAAAPAKASAPAKRPAAAKVLPMAKAPAPAKPAASPKPATPLKSVPAAAAPAPALAPAAPPRAAPVVVATAPTPRPAPKPAPVIAPRTDVRFAGISEADLLRMPADDYMNDVQLAFFRAMLLDMKRELEQNAGATSEHLRENEVVPDPADRATIEEEHALELRTRDRERKLMKKVDQSLRRIEDGSYGWCEETGEPIGLARLLARPTATMSVEAQARRELKQRMYGD